MAERERRKAIQTRENKVRARSLFGTRHTDNALFTRYMHGQVSIRRSAKNQRNEWTRLCVVVRYMRPCGYMHKVAVRYRKFC